jgi:hypothetical protein
MKVNELRERIKKYTRADLERLTVELYKAIPKAKKEDMAVDELIANPSSKKKKSVGTFASLATLREEVPRFIEHAEAQYYLAPNRVVPKGERSKWRFRVKRWYKDLQQEKLSDGDLAKQAELLTQLYSLLCKACGYQYFTAYDPFESVGVAQTEFYESVLRLKWEVDDKPAFIKTGITLIVDNFLNRYTLEGDLMEVLLQFLPIADLRYLAIEKAKELIAEHDFQPPAPEPERRVRVLFMTDRSDYRKQAKHNNLVEMVFRTHAKLFEFDQGIHFYQQHHYERQPEVKLYILIRLLFNAQQPDLIVREINLAEKAGVEPRENLKQLRDHIAKDGQLPRFMN